jgi:hypothetical protein
MPTHNRNKLSVIYDKRQKDFVVKYPRNCDGHLAMGHLVGDILRYSPLKKPYPFEVENFVKELEARGYDIETLKFSIELKQ